MNGLLQSGIKLLQVRQRLKLTQQSVAGYMGISVTTLKRYERGERSLGDLGLYSLIRFCELTHLSINDWIKKSDDFTAAPFRFPEHLKINFKTRRAFEASLSLRLKCIRHERKLTQQQLDELAGWRKGSFARLEKNYEIYRFKDVLTLCRCLNISILDLIGNGTSNSSSIEKIPCNPDEVKRLIYQTFQHPELTESARDDLFKTTAALYFKTKKTIDELINIF